MSKNTRTERDSMGKIEVPSDRYWGAQTQRALQNFQIGTERLPSPIIKAIGLVKLSAAEVNHRLGDLDKPLADAIMESAQEVIDGKLDGHFPLPVWQTGSGTQSNMNANEVIANRATEIMAGKIDSENPVHPNDHVNRSQSTNDTFPTAIHIAAAMEVQDRLLPAVRKLKRSLDSKAADFEAIVKIGRTHLQDATPMTLGQEFSGYADQLRLCDQTICAAWNLVLELPIGGTAVGTGLNTRPEYVGEMVKAISARTNIDFLNAPNTFASMAGKEALVALSGSLKTLAAALNKIGNDIRWLASGPRCGIGEIFIPENEPGSSIMPGKVNPTQVEALTMVVTRVMGNDVTIGMAGSSGNFELNVYMPVIAYTLIQSIDLLADAINSFKDNCVIGIEPNEAQIAHYLSRSLMLVTALNQHIGYDKAAEVAKTAYREGKSLREVVIEKSLLTGEQFDNYVNPEEMIHPKP